MQVYENLFKSMLQHDPEVSEFVRDQLNVRPDNNPLIPYGCEMRSLVKHAKDENKNINKNRH